MDPAIQALIVLGVAIVLYVTERLPLAVTAVGACTALTVMGTVGFSVAFSGFASEMVFLIAGMMVVGVAMFDTGVAAGIGRGLLGVTGKSERSVMVVSMLVIAVLSAFLSNSASIAVFIPIIMGMTASSAGRRLRARHLLLPIAFASSAGGMLSLVGSPPPLIVQDVLVSAELTPFGFFEFAWIGLPILLALFVYTLGFSYPLGTRMFVHRKRRSASATYQSEAPTDNKPHKKIIASLVLALCVVLFSLGTLPPHLVALVGALLVLISGCVSVEQVYRRLDWNTVFLLAGSMGLAAALQASGAGCLMAESALSLLGPAASPFLVLALISGLGMLLTQVMSNTAAAAVLAPVALSMCQQVGISPYPVLMALATTCAAAFATPVATPPNTMVLIAGYRFTDYLFLGGLFNLFTYGLQLALIPLIWPFQ